MKRKFLFFVIPVLAFTMCNRISYEVEKPSYELEMSKLKNYIMYHESQGRNIDTTKLGVLYWVMNEGNGLYPEIGDTLTIIFDGFFTDGFCFETSKDINKETGEWKFVFGEPQAIKGWVDGLKVIDKGAKVEVIIPSTLAFGNKGSGIIPPYTTLIYIIEMKDIKQKKDLK